MTYRNDADALRSRADQLSRELAAVESRLGDVVQLESERARLRRELDRVRADLAGALAGEAPVRLATLRIAKPCRETWDAMVGDERVRHCARCDKDVFNLSEMTQAEAEALLARRGVRPCVRFYQRADGTVKTRDCGDGRPLAAGLLAAGAVAAVAAAGAFMTSARPVAPPPAVVLPEPPAVPDVAPPKPSPTPPAVMGAIAVMGEPPAVENPPETPRMGKPARVTPPKPAQASGGARPRERAR